MRRTLLILAVFAALAFADATGELLTRADQAFAAADYKTAVALYAKLDGQVADPQAKASMNERRRFAEKQLASGAGLAMADGSPAAPASPAPANSAAAASPATQPAARVPHVRPPDGKTFVTTLHGLGNFEYSEDDDNTIPADVRKLDGVKVKIDGVMLPLDQAGRVTKFLLVNDMMSCCYGTAPKIQNVAMVELPKDKWMAASTDRLSIEGTLRVHVKRDDGFVVSIFQIEPTSIKFAAE